MESETKRMIIAMSGHSVSHNTNTAKTLASFLKFPLINQVDIFPTLQKSLPSTTYKKFNLIFDTASQISSTQFNLNLNVIINMELSRRGHYERFVKLASSTGAALIIIHCKTEKDQGGNDYHGGDFGFGHVPTVIIDATKTFIAEVFVPEILRAAEEKKNVDLSIYNPEGAASDAHSSGQDKEAKRDIGDMHAHDFVLSQEPKKENLSCTKCEKRITSGPTYHCVECDDFVLHKECAESPTWGLVDRNRCSTLLRDAPEEYDFSSSIGGCQFCHEFRSSCPDCLLRANIKGEYLPAILKYRHHEHPLNLIIMPFSLNYQYRCSACDEMGKCVSYKCFQCNYDLHTRCAAKKTAIPKEVILQSIDEARDAFQSHFSFVEKLLASHKKLDARTKTALIDTLERDKKSIKILDEFSVGFFESYRTPHPQYVEDLSTLIIPGSSSVSLPDSLTRSIRSVSLPDSHSRKIRRILKEVEKHYHT